MDYYEYAFKITPFANGVDILVSLLEDTSFESFIEDNGSLLAYVNYEKENEAELKTILAADALQEFNVSFTKKLIPQQNWNAEWESSFSHIVVNDNCIIRAPFHQHADKYSLNIIISPKMSFGTGHHETTFLISNQLFEERLKGHSLLDMGCGTGVLAIIAEKLGAKGIEAIDIDDWSVENTEENIQYNNSCGILVNKGDAALLKNKQFNFILANINKNVLMQDATAYYNAMTPQGVILLSGFFKVDVKDLITHYESCGFSLSLEKSRNEWAMLRFTK